MKINELAAELHNRLTTRHPDDGAMLHNIATSPPWVKNLVSSLAGGKVDDFKLEFVAEALEAIAVLPSILDALDSIAPGPLNLDLLNWLSADLNRVELVNEFVRGSKGGKKSFELFGALQGGQLHEKREIFAQVVEGLEMHLKDIQKNS